MYPTLKQGKTGKEVEAAKRGIARYRHDKHERLPSSRIFGPYFTKKVKAFQKDKGILQSGVVGPRTWKALDPYLDTRARELLAGEKPKLVEPYQGFNSLHRSLWEPYSIGRNMGLLDGPGTASGTYNGKSTLPGGGKSDHAYYPALAYDLGFLPQTGWGNYAARQYAIKMANHPAIRYVIIGDKIHSKDRASEGFRPYTSGGHLNHVHCSGFHPGSTDV